MSSLILIIALVVSIFTLGVLTKLLREVNRQASSELEETERRIDELEAQMEKLEKLEKDGE
ncbi:hypothetical protein KQI52_06190 [bacterium]|nr:hypothetical protein [bacterium]